jgi:hypothetical protein
VWILKGSLSDPRSARSQTWESQDFQLSRGCRVEGGYQGVLVSSLSLVSLSDSLGGGADASCANRSWPTIPQLYLEGEFIGGCDIVLAMHQSGELETAFIKAGVVDPVVEDKA